MPLYPQCVNNALHIVGTQMNKWTIWGCNPTSSLHTRLSLLPSPASCLSHHAQVHTSHWSWRARRHSQELLKLSSPPRSPFHLVCLLQPVFPRNRLWERESHKGRVLVTGLRNTTSAGGRKAGLAGGKLNYDANGTGLSWSHRKLCLWDGFQNCPKLRQVHGLLFLHQLVVWGRGITLCEAAPFDQGKAWGGIQLRVISRQHPGQLGNECLTPRAGSMLCLTYAVLPPFLQVRNDPIAV